MKLKNVEKEPQYVVIVGNLIDGHSVFGPFDNGNDASDWAEANAERFAADGETWYAVALCDPKEEQS